MDETDYLFENLDKDWRNNGHPCPECDTLMQYDFSRSNQNTIPIPGNLYGTREPIYRYYKCPNCGFQK